MEGSGLVRPRCRSIITLPKDPWDLFKELADRRHEDVGELYREVAVTDDELATPVLDSTEQ